MADSLDLEAFLADRNTYKIIRHWRDIAESDETADEYYNTSQVGEQWTRKEFRAHFRRAPWEEQLGIHKELNTLSRDGDRLTRDDLEILDQTYNTSGVSREKFATALLALPQSDVSNLLDKANALKLKMVNAISEAYSSRFPGAEPLSRESAHYILSQSCEATSHGSILDAFTTAISSNMVGVWALDGLLKAYHESAPKPIVATDSEGPTPKTALPAVRRGDSSSETIEIQLHSVSSGQIEKFECFSSFKTRRRKHPRQKKRQKKRTCHAYSSCSPSPQILVLDSPLKAFHPSSRSSSPTSFSRDLKQSPEPNLDSTPALRCFMAFMSYLDAQSSFDQSIDRATQSTKNMSRIQCEIDEQWPAPEPSTPTNEIATIDSLPPLKRMAEEVSIGQGSEEQQSFGEDILKPPRKRLRSEGENAEPAKSTTNQERISKYFCNTEEHSSKRSPEKKSLQQSPQRKSPKKSLKKKSPAGKKRAPAGTSCIPFPPLSAKNFGIIQEILADDPFQLLIAVMFLNKTKGTVALPTFFKLMERYPTAEDLANAEPEEVVQQIRHLGLQNQRTKKIIATAKLWLEDPPFRDRRFRTMHYPEHSDGMDVKNADIVNDVDLRKGAYEVSRFPGIGRYGLDSWRIFCRDVLRGVAIGYNGEGAEGDFEPEWKRVLPEDKELRAYLKWMWLREGWIWDPLTGKRRRATTEYLEKVGQGENEFGEHGIVGVEEIPEAIVEE